MALTPTPEGRQKIRAAYDAGDFDYAAAVRARTGFERDVSVMKQRAVARLARKLKVDPAVARWWFDHPDNPEVE